MLDPHFQHWIHAFRFTNILPYDHSRVRLTQVSDQDGADYVNANYMPVIVFLFTAFHKRTSNNYVVWKEKSMSSIGSETFYFVEVLRFWGQHFVLGSYNQ